MGTQYLRSLYWAVTTAATIGYGDIRANSFAEAAFVIAAVFLGALFYQVPGGRAGQTWSLFLFLFLFLFLGLGLVLVLFFCFFFVLSVGLNCMPCFWARCPIRFVSVRLGVLLFLFCVDFYSAWYACVTFVIAASACSGAKSVSE